MKIIRVTALLLTVLLLVGCGAKNAEVDLEQAYQSGMDTIEQANGDIPYMEAETDPQALEQLYPGIGEIARKQTVVYVSPIAMMPAEVVMIEVENSADAAKAADILRARINSRANDAFYPDSVAQWKNAAQVNVSGSYVVMAVMPEGVDLPDEFLAKF